MDNRTDDFYPTRLERPAESFERKDPVIHSQGTDRHNGPLSETELARYERDGFLVFNNFLDQETVKRFRATCEPMRMTTASCVPKALLLSRASRKSALFSGSTNCLIASTD